MEGTSGTIDMVILLRRTKVLPPSLQLQQTSSAPWHMLQKGRGLLWASWLGLRVRRVNVWSALDTAGNDSLVVGTSGVEVAHQKSVSPRPPLTRLIFVDVQMFRSTLS